MVVPYERRATPYGRIFDTTRRAEAIFPQYRIAASLCGATTRRALRLVLQKNGTGAVVAISVNRP